MTARTTWWRVIASGVAGALLCACAPKLSDTDHVTRAREFESKNELRAALIEYKNALQKNPNNIDARQELGELYLFLGKGAAAEKELRHADALGRNAAALIAQALLQQRKSEAVIGECRDGTRLTATAEGWGACAEAYMQRNALEGARQSLARAVALDATLPEVRRVDARVAVASGDPGRAQEIVRTLLEQFPQDARTWFLHGDVAFADGRYADAAAAYEKVLTLDPRDIASMRAIHARIGLVFALLSQDREDLALPHVEVLLKTNPKYFLFNYLRGLLAFKRADYPTALDYLQRTISDNRAGNSALAMLGAVNYALGNLEQADAFLGKYISAVPDDIRARKLQGAVRLKMNQPDKALETLAAGGIESDDVDLLRMMGTAASMSGDFGEGREYFRKALRDRRDEGQIHIQIAQTYLAQGDYARGLAELEAAVKSAGSALQARVLTILTLLKKNDREAALSAARRLAQEHPGIPVSHNILGGVYLALENHAEARASFERALALDSKFTIALFNLALLDQRDKKPDAARAHLERILTIEPRNVQAMIALAQLEEKQGRLPRAVEWLEKGRTADVTAAAPRLLLARYQLRLGKAEAAETLAQEVLKLQPNHPGALSLAGDAQVQRNALDRAQQTFERLTRAHPQDASAHVRLGAALALRAQPAQAALSYRRALSLQPELFPAVAALAALEMREGRADVALRLVEQYAQRHPKVPQALALRGDALAARGQFDAAAESYAAAAKIQNTVALAVKHAQALLHAGRGEAAVEPLKRWLAQQPNDEFAQLNLADLYRRAGSTANAIAQYEAMLKSRPDDPTVLNNLALTYLDAGDKRARATAEVAYKKMSGNSLVADTYGWVLLRTGDAAQARKILELAAKQRSDLPEIQLHLALALEQTGDRAGARSRVEDLLKNHPRFEVRAQAEELARRLR